MLLSVPVQLLPLRLQSPGSLELEAVALLLSTVPSAMLPLTVTVTVRVTLEPPAKLLIFQLTTPAVLLPLSEALTNVTPAGSVSLMTRLVAVESVAVLLTVMV